MCKRSLLVCIGVALIVSSGAYAKGGAVVFHTEADHAKFVPVTSTPSLPGVVIRRAPQHHQHDLIYRPLPRAVLRSN